MRSVSRRRCAHLTWSSSRVMLRSTRRCASMRAKCSPSCRVDRAPNDRNRPRWTASGPKPDVQLAFGLVLLATDDDFFPFAVVCFFTRRQLFGLGRGRELARGLL